MKNLFLQNFLLLFVLLFTFSGCEMTFEEGYAFTTKPQATTFLDYFEGGVTYTDQYKNKYTYSSTDSTLGSFYSFNYDDSGMVGTFGSDGVVLMATVDTNDGSIEIERQRSGSATPSEALKSKGLENTTWYSNTDIPERLFNIIGGNIEYVNLDYRTYNNIYIYYSEGGDDWATYETSEDTYNDEYIIVRIYNATGTMLSYIIWVDGEVISQGTAEK